MNKFVLRLLLILATVVVVVVGGFFLLTSGLNAAVKSGVETVGSQATETPVTLEEVDLSLFSGKGEIRGFTIDNPAARPRNIRIGRYSRRRSSICPKR